MNEDNLEGPDRNYESIQSTQNFSLILAFHWQKLVHSYTCLLLDSGISVHKLI